MPFKTPTTNDNIEQRYDQWWTTDMKVPVAAYLGITREQYAQWLDSGVLPSDVHPE